MELHVQRDSERPEEAGHELRTTVGGDMGRNSVLGKDMEYEELGKSGGVDVVGSRNEDGLFAETVDDDKDGGKSAGVRKLLDEVHRN